jgi:tetratricopeptide (TPR) repeat protein
MALATISTTVAVAMGTLAAFAVASRDSARAARDDALAQRGKAEDLVEFMLSDLSQKLKPSGKLNTLEAVGAKAMAYYNGQLRGSSDPNQLGRRARVMHLLGDISDQKGDLTRAAWYFKQAADSTAQTLAIDPSNSQRMIEHAESLYWLGYIAQRRGQSDGAESDFTGYKRLTETLARRDPRNTYWVSEAADANLDLGVLLFGKGRAAAATSAFKNSLEMNQKLVAQNPMDRVLAMNLMTNFAWLADAESQQVSIDLAMKDRLAERSHCLALLKRQPGDKEIEEILVVNRMAVGDILLSEGNYRGARSELEPAAALSDDLTRIDSTKTDYWERRAFVHLLLARALLEEGQLADAAKSSRLALAIAEDLVARNPTVVLWSGALLGQARVSQIRVSAQTAQRTGDLLRALAPAVPESSRLLQLLAKQPADHGLAKVAAEASLLRGDYEYFSGNYIEATSGWKRTEVILKNEDISLNTRLSAWAKILMSQAQYRLSGVTPWGEAPIRRKVTTKKTSSIQLTKIDYAW